VLRGACNSCSIVVSLIRDSASAVFRHSISAIFISGYDSFIPGSPIFIPGIGPIFDTASEDD
jgi:hypothetical protein